MVKHIKYPCYAIQHEYFEPTTDDPAEDYKAKPIAELVRLRDAKHITTFNGDTMATLLGIILAQNKTLELFSHKGRSDYLTDEARIERQLVSKIATATLVNVKHELEQLLPELYDV